MENPRQTMPANGMARREQRQAAAVGLAKEANN